MKRNCLVTFFLSHHLQIKFSSAERKWQFRWGKVLMPTCRCRYIPLSLKPELGGTTTVHYAAEHAHRPDRPRPLSCCPCWWRTLLLGGRCCVFGALSGTLGRTGLRPRPLLWIHPALETPGSSHLQRKRNYYCWSNILLLILLLIHEANTD